MALFVRQARLTRTNVPLFLCPTVATRDARFSASRECGQVSKRKIANSSHLTQTALLQPVQILNLPQSCPGCGAYTQTIKSDEPGFYSANRKSIKSLAIRKGHGGGELGQTETETFDAVIRHTNPAVLDQLGLYEQEQEKSLSTHGDHRSSGALIRHTAICDRCHNLTYHHAGVSVTHPTLQSISEIISESPHKYNHVYHVLDAADFPLSLIPSLQKNLSLNPPRSMNRRAKSTSFQHGRISEMTYIITRSDLLAPKKEQVDRMMPYILDVLRDALGGSAQNVRLGNVRCVSSKRGWWTAALKEDIYKRGGGGWMVGKVNVGKSNLFEHIYPKGHTQDAHSKSSRADSQITGQPNVTFDSRLPHQEANLVKQHLEYPPAQAHQNRIIDESPLPPAPEEIPFPMMPLVSSLPGTTASPIRLSFGNGKGELVDLPGLDRGDLESFVTQAHKGDLVMRERIKARQLIISPGQSLSIGGLVQIRPTTPNVSFLAYPFVPLPCHISSAEKAQASLTGEVQPNVSTIARPGLSSRMHLAGTFPLKWDVTKQRTGPLTTKAAAGLNIKTLPFVVFSTDILIEGCGWVELVAQVRKKDLEKSETAQTRSFFDDKPYPRVEVTSPDGRHVGYRRPMSAWLLGSDKLGAATGRTSRPRRSMKGVKKRSKEATRTTNN